MQPINDIHNEEIFTIAPEETAEISEKLDKPVDEEPIQTETITDLIFEPSPADINISKTKLIKNALGFSHEVALTGEILDTISSDIRDNLVSIKRTLKVIAFIAGVTMIITSLLLVTAVIINRRLKRIETILDNAEIISEEVYHSTEELRFLLDLKEDLGITYNQQIISGVLADTQNTYHDSDLSINAKIISTVTYEEHPVEFNIEKQSPTTYLITGKNTTNTLVPGKYQLQIDLQKGRAKGQVTQDFSWGVLALNTNKSMYTPGDIAKMYLAVLDEKGGMVCNADLELNIEDPQGKITILTTQDGSIKVNSECRSKKLVTKPDYETQYAVGEPGTYTMHIKAVTNNGEYQISDSFDVRESLMFDVERITATRIYPRNEYPVIYKVIPQTNFQGIITEKVPSSFEIDKLDKDLFVMFSDEKGFPYTQPSTTIQTPYYQEIEWVVDWIKGATYYLGYQYNAPDISPQFYLLGPSVISTKETDLDIPEPDFTEARQWQIAVDGTSEILAARGTFVTPSSTGDTAVTSVGFQPKAIMLFGTLRTSDGTGDHANYFFGFSDGTSHKSFSIRSEDSGLNDNGRASENYAMMLREVDNTALNVATVSGFGSDGFTLDYTTANPGYIIHYIAFGGADLEAEVGEKAVNSGTTPQLDLTSSTLEPDLIFLGTVGLTIPASDDNTHGISAFGVVGNSASWYIATHQGSNNTTKDGYVKDDACLAQLYNNNIDWEMNNCTLESNGMSWIGSNSDEFGYLALDLGGNNEVVGTFTKEGTGTDGAEQDLIGWGFEKYAAVVGFASAGKTTEGVTDHARATHGTYDGTSQGIITYTDVNGSTASDSAQNSNYAIGIAESNADIVAAATASRLTNDGVTLTWSPNNTISYIIGYWAIEGTKRPPDAPTLHDVPFESAELYATTPHFEFTADDPDGSADIIYQIQWDDNPDFTSPTTRTSDTHAGFINTETIDDTNPFNEDERIRFTIQPGDALSNSSDNTAYYWRARAKDDSTTGGSGYYGDWTDWHNFRVNDILKIDRWLQTVDEQFDQGTFNDARTTGSDSIENYGMTKTYFTTDGTSTFVVPAGVTSITVKAWGGGGAGGAGGTQGQGGAGGGGGFAQATLSVSPSETLDVIVAEGGSGGTYPGSNSGGGGGGGGRSAVERTGTPLIITAGGGGGGGGDNSSTIAGGGGGGGGGTSGLSGNPSSNAGGGGGGTDSAGGAGGTGSGGDHNEGAPGSSEQGGAGANGGANESSGDGEANNGGDPNGGHGGTGNTGGYGGGGGGGDGYYGGGGGCGSVAGNAGGGGGGGGSSYTTGSDTSTETGSGINAGNNDDDDYGGDNAGQGGTGGTTTSSGSVGNDGRIVIMYPESGGTGTVMSPPVDYAWLPSMNSWDEFDWSEDETHGSISTKLFYSNTEDCDTVVPNVALSGNESGFTSGPIDITGLNTTTYDNICLQTSLTESGGTPYLEDWYIQWGLDVSGTIYLANKSTQATTGNGGQCNGSTENLSLKVEGVSEETTYCSDSDASFIFSGVQLQSGDSISVYSTDGTDKSNRVYITDGSADTSVDLYKDTIALADLVDSSITIDDLIFYDSDTDDTNMLFDADSGSPDTLTWESGTQLYIPASQTFTPGGNTNGHDIEIDGVWTAAAGETINIDGSFVQNASATFNPSTSTLTFDATSGTEDLITDGTGDIYNLVINDGGGGSLLVEVEDPLTVQNNLTITNGSLDIVSGENNQINVGGNWTNDDTFIERAGTIVFDGASDATLDSGCVDEDTCTNENFYNLTINKDEDSKVTLSNTHLRVTNLINIMEGWLIQGVQNIRAEGATAIDVDDFGRWENTSTGDITLGGDVINDGNITLNANGMSCGDNDDIAINSTDTTPRAWNGAGGFRITDVNVQYQTGSAIIYTTSSTNSGNMGSNWFFIGCDVFLFNSLNLEGIDIG